MTKQNKSYNIDLQAPLVLESKQLMTSTGCAC